MFIKACVVLSFWSLQCSWAQTIGTTKWTCPLNNYYCGWKMTYGNYNSWKYANRSGDAFIQIDSRSTVSTTTLFSSPFLYTQGKLVGFNFSVYNTYGSEVLVRYVLPTSNKEHALYKIPAEPYENINKWVAVSLNTTAFNITGTFKLVFAFEIANSNYYVGIRNISIETDQLLYGLEKRDVQENNTTEASGSTTWTCPFDTDFCGWNITAPFGTMNFTEVSGDSFLLIKSNYSGYKKAVFSSPFIFTHGKVIGLQFSMYNTFATRVTLEFTRLGEKDAQKVYPDDLYNKTIDKWVDVYLNTTKYEIEQGFKLHVMVELPVHKSYFGIRNLTVITDEPMYVELPNDEKNKTENLTTSEVPVDNTTSPTSPENNNSTFVTNQTITENSTDNTTSPSIAENNSTILTNQTITENSTDNTTSPSIAENNSTIFTNQTITEDSTNNTTNPNIPETNSTTVTNQNITDVTTDNTNTICNDTRNNARNPDVKQNVAIVPIQANTYNIHTLNILNYKKP